MDSHCLTDILSPKQTKSGQKSTHNTNRVAGEIRSNKISKINLVFTTNRNTERVSIIPSCICRFRSMWNSLTALRSATETFYCTAQLVVLKLVGRYTFLNFAFDFVNFHFLFPRCGRNCLFDICTHQRKNRMQPNLNLKSYNPDSL